MEATEYLRLLQSRWKLWLVALGLGALLGYASTALSAEPEVTVETYWVARHTLVVDAEALSRFPNLPQLALRATGAEVAATAGDELGLDPAAAAARVRTVTRPELNAIEISATSTDPDDAALVADAFADALTRYASAEDLAAYDAQLASIRERLGRLNDGIEDDQNRLEEVEEAIIDAGYDPRTGRPLDPEEEDPVDAETLDLLDEHRELDITVQGKLVSYQETLAEEADLLAAGEPAPYLETIDRVAPYRISQTAYDRRLAQGRQGANNFISEDPGDGADGSSIGDRLDHPVIRAGMGAGTLLLLAVGAVLLHLRFDPRLRVKRDIEASFGYPVLAEIPPFTRRQRRRPEIHTLVKSRSTIAEAYRMVRSGLLFSQTAVTAAPDTSPAPPDRRARPGRPVPVEDEREVRVVMVTSPGPSEGKTTTTANLAVVLAEAGYEVLVVNCDYRLPRLHLYFEAPLEARTALDTGIPGVTLVADVSDRGVDNPTAMVEAQRRLIERARDRYDVVLLDTAPVLATNDAMALLPNVDLVVLVAREGHTSREAAVETGDLLRRRGANVAGIVLTNAAGSGGSRYYQKYRYGSYYTTSDEVGERRDRRRRLLHRRRRTRPALQRRSSDKRRVRRRGSVEAGTAPFAPDTETLREPQHQN